jgi:hypothetical protein
MKTAPTNKKIRQIINDVKDGRILPRPEFQRRLVWKIEDKNHFLDSVIRGYPFPEIYLADGEVDLDTGQGTQLLVDGLQRVSTIVQYFNGSPDLKLFSVPAYRDLTDDQKSSFLQYDIAVRDLGNLSKSEVVEVFKRINSTKYSLTDIEISNAVYRGALKEFAENLSTDSFFVDNRVFGALDMRRMGDLRFALLITITAMSGYFNRDDKFEQFLEMYNDEFPSSKELYNQFQFTFHIINEFGFDLKCRAWRKSDLYTLISEIIFAIRDNVQFDIYRIAQDLESFYNSVDLSNLDQHELAGVYYKSAVQASNDRGNRVKRGEIIKGILRNIPTPEVFEVLQSERLL